MTKSNGGIMKVYVCEEYNIENPVPYISIHSTLESAYVEACNSAIDQMELFHADDLTMSTVESNNSYKKVCSYVTSGNFVSALDEYVYWNIKRDFSIRYVINVYGRLVKGESNIKEEQEILQDVPCKQCKRNVNASESVCWHCGVSNPAIS
jgi:hypothetical protein